jgi:ketosteroid isomerase-like protein
MSRENAQVVRDGMDAFNRRDRAAWMALYDPDYETIPTGDWPESGPIRGREAVWDFYVEIDELWEGTGPYSITDLIDADNGRVAAHLTRELVGKGSGAAVSYDYWIVFTLADGTIRRGEFFETRRRALEAAELRQ